MGKRKSKAVATPDVKRVPVDFNYTGLNWDFIHAMAQIPPYADEKYTSWSQYTHARLEGEKSPANHIIAHLRSYMHGVPYDKFDGDVGRHLVAIAYNAMMEWYYLKKFGHKVHPLAMQWPHTAIAWHEVDRTMGSVAAVLLDEKKRKRRKAAKRRGKK